MFTRLALAAFLRLHDPTAQHRYTLADLQMPDSYTIQDLEADLAREAVCQCFTIKVSPEGSVIGTARACSCDE